MYKVIKKGEVLTITGQNIYSGADTSVYWNSVTEENKAEIIPSSFNAENTQVQINVPCCLPDENKAVVYNGVGYITGTQDYRFIGAPSIDTFSPSEQLWQNAVLIKGNHLDNITGLFLEGQQVTDHDWPSSKKVVFDMPNGFNSGYIEIYTDVGNVKSTGILRGIAPPIYGTLPNPSQGRIYGEKVSIEGKSLHKVNRVVLSGVEQEIFLYDNSLVSTDTTGLSFTLPNGVVDNSPITIQDQTGYFQEGQYITNVNEEYALGSQIKIDSVYIQNVNKTSEVYDYPITVSGVNLNKSKILFLGHGNQYIEGAVTDTGLYHSTVNVPKNILRSNVVASGYLEGLTGTHFSQTAFYPLPTIHSISKSDWTMGETIEIEAINASEIYPTIGFTGQSLLNTSKVKHFVSNIAEYNSQVYFGDMNLDDSSLEQSPTTGRMKISALINGAMVGEGNPFLISNYEVGAASSITDIYEKLKNSSTYDNFHKVTGEAVLISGKKPEVLGLSAYRTEASGFLVVSGTHFFTATGLKLAGGGEEKIIPHSQFLDGLNISPVYSSLPPNIQGSFETVYQGYNKFAVINTGAANSYEQLHAVVVNLSDFNFTGKSGDFSITTPYHV